jgi:hypothetical protein
VYIGAVTAARHGALRIKSLVRLSLPALFCVALCGQAAAAQAATTATKASQAAPKTSYGQDTKYFNEVTQADPKLATYAEKGGNVALRALLTDGTAFCALLKRGGGIDEALVAEADGVRGTESKTNLPLSVTTFNTIEAVALLTLCPTEQHLLPATDRSRIRNLGNALAGHGG